jgi:hypothetical protein
MPVFLETAPPVFDKLVAAIRSGDWVTAKASAHWLRGGASGLIAPGFQEQLAHLENTWSTSSPAVSDSELASLTGAFRHACAIAESWLAENTVEGWQAHPLS